MTKCNYHFEGPDDYTGKTGFESVGRLTALLLSSAGIQFFCLSLIRFGSCRCLHAQCSVSKHSVRASTAMIGKYAEYHVAYIVSTTYITFLLPCQEHRVVSQNHQTNEQKGSSSIGFPKMACFTINRARSKQKWCSAVNKIDCSNVMYSTVLYFSAHCTSSSTRVYYSTVLYNGFGVCTVLYRTLHPPVYCSWKKRKINDTDDNAGQ